MFQTVSNFYNQSVAVKLNQPNLESIENLQERLNADVFQGDELEAVQRSASGSGNLNFGKIFEHESEQSVDQASEATEQTLTPENTQRPLNGNSNVIEGDTVINNEANTGTQQATAAGYQPEITTATPKNIDSTVIQQQGADLDLSDMQPTSPAQGSNATGGNPRNDKEANNQTDDRSLDNIEEQPLNVDNTVKNFTSNTIVQNNTTFEETAVIEGYTNVETLITVNNNAQEIVTNISNSAPDIDIDLGLDLDLDLDVNIVNDLAVNVTDIDIQELVSNIQVNVTENLEAITNFTSTLTGNLNVLVENTIQQVTTDLGESLNDITAALENSLTEITNLTEPLNLAESPALLDTITETTTAITQTISAVHETVAEVHDSINDLLPDVLSPSVETIEDVLFTGGDNNIVDVDLSLINSGPGQIDGTDNDTDNDLVDIDVAGLNSHANDGATQDNDILDVDISLQPQEETTIEDNDLVDVDISLLDGDEIALEASVDVVEEEIIAIDNTSDNNQADNNDILDVDVGILNNSPDTISGNDNDIVDIDVVGLNSDANDNTSQDNDVLDTDISLNGDNVNDAPEDTDIVDIDLSIINDDTINPTVSVDVVEENSLNPVVEPIETVTDNTVLEPAIEVVDSLDNQEDLISANLETENTTTTATVTEALVNEPTDNNIVDVGVNALNSSSDNISGTDNDIIDIDVVGINSDTEDQAVTDHDVVDVDIALDQQSVAENNQDTDIIDVDAGLINGETLEPTVEVNLVEQDSLDSITDTVAEVPVAEPVIDSLDDETLAEIEVSVTPDDDIIDLDSGLVDLETPVVEPVTDFVYDTVEEGDLSLDLTDLQLDISHDLAPVNDNETTEQTLDAIESDIESVLDSVVVSLDESVATVDDCVNHTNDANGTTEAVEEVASVALGGLF